MNIKSLLLGSAAALVAVSGAHAADAVIAAEPEPVDYVRVCDVYGAGFFYIPGTETCLKIGGYVRYDASVGSQYNGYDGLWNLDKRKFADGTEKWQGTWNKTAKIVLNVDTGQETEYGTLATHIGIVAKNTTGYKADDDGDPTGLSTTTIKPVALPFSAISRSIIGGVTTGEVISTPSIPPPAITSASPRVEQQMPTAPAAICRLPISIDLAPFECGRNFRPVALVCAAMAAMLRSSASRSSSRFGVLSSVREPLTPMNFAFGPSPLDSAIVISRFQCTRRHRRRSPDCPSPDARPCA